VSKFKKSERRTTMEEQDRTLEPEEGQEDVEAHATKAREVNRQAAKDDESDDVEAHVTKARTINKDEVEEGKYKY
jgi:hypothetical protein